MEEAVAALVRLAAWKLDTYGRDPGGTCSVYSHGSDRFRAGTLGPAAGDRRPPRHQRTACPGQHLYGMLPGPPTGRGRIDRW